MIPANELRIGNIFWEDYGGYKVVTAIGQNKVGYAKDTVSGAALGMSISGQFDCAHIQPMPLTPELLEKCGFHKYNNAWVEEDFDPIKYLTFYYSIWDEDGEYRFNGQDFTPPLKYLHTLQNHYFANKQTELKINL